MLLSAFHSVLPSIGAYYTVEAYYNAKPSNLSDLQYKVVILRN